MDTVRWFCFFTIFIFPFLINAQTVTVYNLNNMKPLDNVLIYSSTKEYSRITDQNGQADISALSANDSIYFSHSAFQKSGFRLIDLKASSYNVYLVKRIYEMSEFVIGVSRERDMLQQITNKVDVITSKDIEFSDPQTSADMLENTGNVYIQRSQMGGGSPVLRGFEANKVLLVVDGVRMNNAIYRSGHVHNVISIDNSVLERTEVIYGPGSVVYGSDAIGGVMHFMTKEPELSISDTVLFQANVYTRYATANREKSAHVNFNIAKQKWASLTAFTFNDFGDLKMGSMQNPFYGDWGKREFYTISLNTDNLDSVVLNPDPLIQTPTAYSQYSLLQKILFQPNPSLKYLLNFQHSASSDVPRYDRLTEMDENDNFRFAEWYYGPQIRYFTSFNVNWLPYNRIIDQANFIIAHQKIYEERNSRRFANAERIHRMETVDMLTLNTDIFKSITTQHDLQYGIEAVVNYVESDAYSENVITSEKGYATSRYPDDGNKMQTYAVYLRHKWKLNPKMIFTSGVRYTQILLESHFSDDNILNLPFDRLDINSSALSGNIGFTYNPDKNWQIRLMLASGFRAPNVDDAGKVFDSSPGSVMVPNNDLGPEYVYTVESGISRHLGENSSLSAGLFYTFLDDAILRQDFTLDGKDSIVYEGVMSRVQANVNAGQAEIYGFTFNFSASVTSEFSINSNLSYTYGRDISNNHPMPNIPPVFGQTNFIYEKSGWRGDFFIRYNGWKRVEDYSPFGVDNLRHHTEHGSPAWFTLNLRSSYQLIEQFRIQFSVENILDVHYRPFASGISAPGRNFVVTLRGNI